MSTLTAASSRPVSGLRPALAGLVLLVFAALIWVAPRPAAAAERGRIEAFLQVTGFDVALDSIAFSAGAAPKMLGIDPGAFGSEWSRLTREVFDTAVMRELALDILEPTLQDDWLDHAATFYAGDLGQKLVAAENAAHMDEDDAAKKAEGARLLAQLRDSDAPRVALLERMNAAIDGTDASLRALQEIQFRFLMAASAAGVVELRLDADALRALLAEKSGEMRESIRASALAGAAYTYRDFTDAEIEAYAVALEAPEMRRVYELLSAVQYEVMANRFEALAQRMSGLRPGEDI